MMDFPPIFTDRLSILSLFPAHTGQVIDSMYSSIHSRMSSDFVSR